MTKAKRYFWLKLKEDFFNQKEIKLLRKIAGGDTYTVIYLKLLLLSLKNDGKIYFDGLTDEFAEEIALEIDESVENVTVTLQFLQKKGLIAYDNDHQDEFELTNIASMIGSETDKAAMMRRKRARDKQLEKLTDGNSVTEMLPNRYTELELEKELDLEQEQQLEQKPKSAAAREKEIDALYSKINHLPYMQNTTVVASLEHDYDRFGYDIMNHVIDQALLAGAKSYKYIGSILERYKLEGLTTLEAVLAESKPAYKKSAQNKRTAFDHRGKTYRELYSEDQIRQMAELSGVTYEELVERRIDG